MSFREGATGSRLQVTLEAQSLSFGRELDDDDGHPGAVFLGVAARPLVVPLQPIVDVACHADVVTVGVDVTPKDVDEALPYSLHAPRLRTSRADPLCLASDGNPSDGGKRETTVCRFCNPGAGMAWKNLLLFPGLTTCATTSDARRRSRRLAAAARSPGRSADTTSLARITCVRSVPVTSR